MPSNVEQVVENDVRRDISLCIVQSGLNLTQGRIWLSTLRKYFPELPADPRTLLRTPRQCQRVEIGEGSYVHIGLQSSMRYIISRYGKPVAEPIKLQIHIDGLSMFSSSNLQLWPIQCRIINIPHFTPFVVGVYAGKGKPTDPEAYLRLIVTELDEMFRRGIILSSELSLRVELSSVICDAPARMFVRQVKGHSGYYGCDKCSQRGCYCAGRMTFPELDAHLRSDITFRQRKQPQHHIGYSAFEKLPIDMVTIFPSEYMHMVCHGVTRRLLHLWFTSKYGRRHRLGVASVRSVNERLRAVRTALPVEFSRLCRDLQDLERWKATEFRQFLLYLGPCVLKGILEQRKYEHFLKLSVAIYLLCHPILCQKYISFTRQMLKHFVNDTRKIYGPGAHPRTCLQTMLTGK